MKIAIIISSMDAGGAERIVALLSNYWVENGMDVDIVTFDNIYSKSFYKLNPKVKHRHLEIIGRYKGLIRGFKGNIAKIIALRNNIKSIKPDVVISFIDQTNVLTILSSAFLGIPIIVTEHIDTRYYSPGIFWGTLRMILYPFASSMVTVSRGVLESFPKYMRRNAVVIPNPVNNIKINGTKNKEARKTIIGMGRLTHQKGFDLLIKAFKILKDKNPGWDLIIYGEGSKKKELEKLISDMKLENRVKLAGVTNDSSDKFRKADLFVLSSRFEGFGIVLIEAMSCGLPVISYDCQSGPGEIIHNGIDGILVPSENINALSEAMDKLMNNNIQRNTLASKAKESSCRFNIEVISIQWKDLFKKLGIAVMQ